MNSPHYTSTQTCTSATTILTTPLTTFNYPTPFESISNSHKKYHMSLQKNKKRAYGAVISYVAKKALPLTRINWLKYWESQHQDPFACTESLQSFDTIKRFLFRFIHRDSAVLIVGCGNSRLGECLYDSGVENITCTDCSETVIHLMKLRNRSEGRRKMIHEVMDYANMSYDDRSYDIVIDKNVLDTFMSIQKDENKAAQDAVKHVSRILKPGGVFMMLSYAKASTRFPVLGWAEDPDFCYRFTDNMPWKHCEANKVAKPTSSGNLKMDDWALEEDINHFFYTCEKKGGPGKRATRLYPEDHEAMAKRLSNAVEGALREESDDDGLFDNDNSDEEGEAKKEKTEEELREEALEKSRLENQKAKSFFSQGYLKAPAKWG